MMCFFIFVYFSHPVDGKREAASTRRWRAPFPPRGAGEVLDTGGVPISQF